jgi:hypothetical protein
MTDDGRGTRKKSWKAFQVNYDTIRAASERLCCHCLSEQQVLAIMAMVEYLKWPTRWVSDEGDIDRDFIDAFTSGLEFQIMSGCADENIPIQYRYSSAGVLERSLNGGTTWTDASLYDPRVNSPTFPPIPGDDGASKRCAAAASAAALIEEQIGAQLTDDMTRYTLNQLINDWTQVYIGTSNPFQALMTVISNQIFALVIATLRPALTSEVYDTLRCIIYCHISSSAFVSGAAWYAIRSDITDQITGIAGVFLEHLVYLLGNGGLTNLCRSGAIAEATCDDCDLCPEPCNQADWINGVYYLGVDYNARGGTIVERGDNYMVLQSTPRGDGDYEIAFYPTDHVSQCAINWYFVESDYITPGGVPTSVLKWYNPPPLTAALEDQVRNDLLVSPVMAAQIYFQMTAGTTYLRVEFV